MSFALRSFGMGFVAGLRSMTAPAVALAATGSPLALPAGILAAGELFADKLPIMPSRLEQPGLAARVLSGAYCAFVLADAFDGDIGCGLSNGVLGALSGAWSGYHLRKKLDESTPVPDIFLGLAEDAVALGAAFLLAQREEVQTQPESANASGALPGDAS
jgi:uncharacterized membrane protein